MQRTCLFSTEVCPQQKIILEEQALFKSLLSREFEWIGSCLRLLSIKINKNSQCLGNIFFYKQGSWENYADCTEWDFNSVRISKIYLCCITPNILHNNDSSG